MRHHLLLADTATRRDLGDDRTISRFAEAVGDTERNALLYALTIGDSRATGPAAWNSGKAALVRELYVEDGRRVAGGGSRRRRPSTTRTATWPRRWARRPPTSTSTRCRRRTCAAFGAPELARHRDLLLARERAVRLGGAPRRSVALHRRGARSHRTPRHRGRGVGAASASTSRARSRPRTRAGTRSRCSPATTASSGWPRQTTGHARPRPSRAALDGTVALDEQLRERSRRYRPAAPTVDRDVRVLVDTDASAHATVVEVHAPDDVGLLARVAAVFVDLDLDVDQAIVSTAGDRVVDVFYLDDVSGARFARRHAVEALRATLLEPPHRGRDARRAPRTGRLVSRP